MEKLKIFYLKYKHAVPLIIYAIIYMTWFAWLEKNTTGHYRIIHMAADDYIPFVRCSSFLTFVVCLCIGSGHLLFSKIKRITTAPVFSFLQA